MVAEYSEPILTISFPGGKRERGVVERGARVQTRFFSTPREATLVNGRFAQALSDHFGRPLRLVEVESAVDRGPKGAASLVSRASLDRLAEVAGESGIDGRRFRMLIEVDGIDAHAEDRGSARA